MKFKNQVAWLILFIFTSIPSSCQISILGELTHEFFVMQNGQYSGSIEIVNTSEKSERVHIFQTDYFFTFEDQSYYPTPAGRMPRSNATWISYGPDSLDIPPNSQRVIQYKIRMPDDTTLVGTYWSLIMIASSDHPQTILRYGIQIITQFGDTGKRDMQVLETQLKKEPPLRTLQIDLQNTGERLLKPVAWTEIFSSQGEQVQRIDNVMPRIFPGCSIRYPISLQPLPPDIYKIVIVFDIGSEELLGLSYEMTIENE